MGLFDGLGDKFSEAVDDVDFNSVIMQGVNGYFQANRAAAPPMIVQQAPAIVAAQPVAAPTSRPAVKAAVISLPIMIALGVAAYFILGKKRK